MPVRQSPRRLPRRHHRPGEGPGNTGAGDRGHGVRSPPRRSHRATSQRAGTNEHPAMPSAQTSPRARNSARSVRRPHPRPVCRPDPRWMVPAGANKQASGKKIEYDFGVRTRHGVQGPRPGAASECGPPRQAGRPCANPCGPRHLPDQGRRPAPIGAPSQPELAP